MIESLASNGVPSLFSLTQQQIAGKRDIKALRYAAANDAEFAHRPIPARQNAAYAVAFSLDRRDPAYAVAFSAI